MAKESTERKKIRKNLIQKGDSILFAMCDYIKVSRMIQDMNRIAREKRIVEPEDVLYSVQKEKAPDGQFFVIRNF